MAVSGSNWPSSRSLGAREETTAPGRLLIWGRGAGKEASKWATCKWRADLRSRFWFHRFCGFSPQVDLAGADDDCEWKWE